MSVYLRDVRHYLPMLAAAVAALWTAGRFRLTRRRWRWAHLIVLLAVVAVIPLRNITFLGEIMGWKSILAFALMTLAVYNTLASHNTRHQLDTLLLVTVSVVMAAGSDTGLMNCFLIMAVFSPLLLIDFGRLRGWTVFSRGVMVAATICCVEHYMAYLTYNHISQLFHTPQYTTFLRPEYKSDLEARCADARRYTNYGRTVYYGCVGHEAAAITKQLLPYSIPYSPAADDIRETSRAARYLLTTPGAVIIDYTRSPLLRQALATRPDVLTTQASASVVYRHKTVSH